MQLIISKCITTELEWDWLVLPILMRWVDSCDLYFDLNLNVVVKVVVGGYRMFMGAYSCKYQNDVIRIELRTFLLPWDLSKDLSRLHPLNKNKRKHQQEQQQDQEQKKSICEKRLLGIICPYRVKKNILNTNGACLW